MLIGAQVYCFAVERIANRSSQFDDIEYLFQCFIQKNTGKSEILYTLFPEDEGNIIFSLQLNAKPVQALSS